MSTAPALVATPVGPPGERHCTSRRSCLHPKITERAARGLLRQAKQLEDQLAGFCGGVRGLMTSLDKALPEPEVEAMVTPEANILGALECLLADDLQPALRKLRELEGLLR